MCSRSEDAPLDLVDVQPPVGKDQDSFSVEVALDGLRDKVDSLTCQVQDLACKLNTTIGHLEAMSAVLEQLETTKDGQDEQDT